MWSNNIADAKFIMKIKGDQTEVFKILNGHENIDPNIFLTSKITRGHDFTLEKEQSRLDVRKYSFSQRSNEWIKLSVDCVHSSSINTVKNIIDNYLIGAGYTQIDTCGLSISQRLPCLQPSELLLGWQFC